MRATEEVPAATDLGVLKEALERIGVGHRNVSGVAERAHLLAGGTVLRFDLEVSYLGAATSDYAPATPAAEDGRETSSRSSTSSTRRAIWTNGPTKTAVRASSPSQGT